MNTLLKISMLTLSFCSLSIISGDDTYKTIKRLAAQQWHVALKIYGIGMKKNISIADWYDREEPVCDVCLYLEKIKRTDPAPAEKFTQITIQENSNKIPANEYFTQYCFNHLYENIPTQKLIDAHLSQPKNIEHNNTSTQG